MSELTREEKDIIESCFRNFTDKDGNVKLNDLVGAMESFGIDKANPIIYDLVAQFAQENVKNKSVSYEDFVSFIQKKLADKDSKESIDRIYELFLEGTNSKTIDFNALRKVVDEVGEKLTDDEIRTIFQRAASNGKDFDYDEFYELMTKKVKAN